MVSSNRKAIELTLGGIVFKTKTAAMERVKRILHESPLNVPLSGEDLRIARSLLELHPNAQQKIGCGVRQIEVRRHNDFGPSTPCMYAIREDGTVTDFSYIRCFDGDKSYRKKFLAACREAIKQHLDHFKTEFFRVAKKPTCQLTAEPLTPDNCHVDHIPPYAFERIVESFAVLYSIDLNDPKLCVSDVDCFLIPTFSSALMRDNFIVFHNSLGQFRCISAAANTSLVRNTVQS